MRAGSNIAKGFKGLVALLALTFGWSLSGQDSLVDLLVVYTQDVEDYYGGTDGTEAYVRSCIESSNQAYENSGVSMRLRLVGFEKITDYTPSVSDMGVDLDYLENVEGVMDDVHVWRHNYGADVGTLFRLNTAGNTAGIARLLVEANGNDFRAFSVVTAKYALSSLILQHEVGHTMGANHDRENAGSAELTYFDYSYGHRFTVDGSSRVTLMSYPDFGEMKINYFSNPNVRVEGVQTGVASGANAADNARTLEFFRGVVSGYKAHIHRSPVANAGPDIELEDLDGNGSETIELDGYLSSYEDVVTSWRWSWSGGSATGVSASRSFPVGTRTVTLTMTDDEGEVSTDTLQVRVRAQSPIAGVFAGSFASYVVKESGVTYFSGDGHLELDEIAYYSNADALTDIELQGVASIASGSTHALYLKSNGSLFGSGSNYYRQLGGSGPSEQRTPLEILASGVTTAAVGDQFSVFTKSDGSFWSMGRNFDGALGFGSQFSQQTPGRVIASGVRSAYAGPRFSLALKIDGSLWGMGTVLSYALGPDSGNELRSPPTEIFSEGVESVAVGDSHVVVLKDDGSVWTFGESNFYGQLLTGLLFSSLYPEKVVEDGAVAVYAGPNSTFVRFEDGSLWGAGDNTGAESDSDSIFEEMLGGNVVDVAVGREHTIALRSDGSLWGMGSNASGQLGLGNQIQTARFTKLLGTSQTIANSDPVANAGEDLLIGGIFGGNENSVTLDGSASSDDWFVASWNWSWTGGSAQGIRPQGLSFSPGLNEVELEVVDDTGRRSTDTLEVFVSDDADYRSRLLAYFSQNEIDAMDDAYGEDSDLDGLNNKGEVLLGLDPNNFASRFRLEERRGPEGLTIVANGLSNGREFALLGSSDLVNWHELSEVPEWLNGESVTYMLGQSEYTFFKMEIR